MSLSSTLLKALAVARAPRASLVLTHPVGGTAALIALRAARKAAPPRLGSALLWIAVSAAVPLVLRARGRRRAGASATESARRGPVASGVAVLDE